MQSLLSKMKLFFLTIVCMVSISISQGAWTFVSSPDMFNSDIADLSGGTDASVAALYDASYASNLVQAAGWPSASGGKNGVTAAMATVYNQLIQEMVTNAGGSPEAFVAAGDLINGRWFNANTLNMFDPGGNDFGKLNNAADVYFPWYRELFRQNGISVVIGAIGDHDVGDNDWPVSSNKANHVNTMKVAFGRNMVDPLGLPATWNGISSTAPAGTGEYDEGSFVMQIQNVLFVTVDIFEFEAAGTKLHYRYGAVDGNISGNSSDPGTHLGWLEAILTAADSDSSVDHVILQGHAPTLHGVRKQASSGMMIRNRGDSGFWQTLRDHEHQNGGKVRLYFAGEVHTITASKDPYSDIVQIVHGNPPLGGGGGNYVIYTVDGDLITADLYQFDLSSTGGGNYWQPSSTNSTGCGSMAPSEHTGTLVIDTSGSETTYLTSGWMDLVNPDGVLINFSFDETIPGGNQSNTGQLGNLYYNAWANGDPLTVPGKFGNAMWFDNDGDFYKTSGGLAPISEGQARSVTGWFLSGWTDSASAEWDTIFGYGQDDINHGEFNVRLANGTIHLHTDNNTLVYADVGSLNLYDSQWHHFAVVLSDAHESTLSDVIFYIDGQQYPGVLSTPDTFDKPIRTYPGSKSNIHIGASAEDLRAPGNRFNGYLDDISLWGSALTTGKARSLYTTGNHPSLEYDVLQMESLFDLFNAGQGQVDIGADTWIPASGLSGNAGDVLDLGISFAIVLDDSGNGIQQSCAGGSLVYDRSGPDGNPDCKVDLYDLIPFMDNWLDCQLIPAAACF